jgi:hypothetical protein
MIETGALIGMVLGAFFATAFVVNILHFFVNVAIMYRNERRWNKLNGVKSSRRSTYFSAKGNVNKEAEKLVKKSEKVLAS